MPLTCLELPYLLGGRSHKDAKTFTFSRNKVGNYHFFFSVNCSLYQQGDFSVHEVSELFSLTMRLQYLQRKIPQLSKMSVPAQQDNEICCPLSDYYKLYKYIQYNKLFSAYDSKNIYLYAA